MKPNQGLRRLVACAAFALAASAANAETLLFTLTGAATASWQMDSMPTPDFIYDGAGFEVDGISGTFGGTATTANIEFINGTSNGGLRILGTGLVNNGRPYFSSYGPTVYSGSENMPVFSPGTFVMLDQAGTSNYSLTISAVPEPATLALMLGGLGLVGFTASRRRAS